MSALSDVRKAGDHLATASHMRGLAEYRDPIVRLAGVMAENDATGNFMAAIAAAETEIEALRADAERYRWLANGTEGRLDAAIDAKMKGNDDGR